MEFKNEIGNSISIQVAQKEISGVPGILISIVGPDSETEVHITKHEAEVLQEELGRVL